MNQDVKGRAGSIKLSQKNSPQKVNIGNSIDQKENLNKSPMDFFGDHPKGGKRLFEALGKYIERKAWLCDEVLEQTYLRTMST